MKVKKSLITLLMSFSLIMSMMLVSCPDPNSVGDAGVIRNEKTGVKFENTSEGIKISWSDISADAAYISIRSYTSDSWLGSYYLFEIFDLKSQKSVIDKYVTPGKEYQYFIDVRNKNNNWIASSNEWIKITALGGKGELDYNLTPNNDGIKLTKTASSTKSRFSFVRSGNYYSSEYNFNKTGNLDFTDKYVDANKEYTYRLNEQIGSTGYWENGQRVEYDDVVEYPRYKEKKVTATGGSGSIKFLTVPQAVYSAENNSVELTTDPVFSVTSNDWSLQPYYHRDGWGSGSLFDSFSSNNKTSTIYSWREEGEYTLEDCWVKLSFNDYSVGYWEVNSEESETLKNLPQTITVSDENKFHLEATPTAEGIKLEWKKLPQGTTRLEIDDDILGELFEINDLTNITSVTDKYVSKDKEYSYRVIARNANGNWLEDSSWKTVTATGGAGENKFDIQATTDGIKITGTRISNASSFVILKSSSDNNDNEDKIYLNDTNQNFDFTDVFVLPGKEYFYSVRARIGEEGYWRNGVYTGYDDKIEYPRYEIKQAKATGGCGDIKITNKPSVTYNSSACEFTFSKALEFSVEPESYSILFNYRKENWGSSTLLYYDSRYNQTLKTGLNNSDATGEWNFNRYWFTLRFDTYSYEHEADNLDEFESFPANLNLSEQAKPKLTATPTDTGIKFQWENLPENYQTIQVIYRNKNGNTDTCIEIKDKTKTEFTATLLNKSTEYDCRIDVRNSNGRWISSETVSVTTKANAGEGEPKITNNPAATFDNKNTVTFTVLPQIEISQDYEWELNFNYRYSNGNTRELYECRKGDQRLKKTIRNDIDMGTWTFDNIHIWVNTDDFTYNYTDYNVSNLPDIPKTIVLSEENQFRAVTTATDDGIKIEWKNLPEGTKQIDIRSMYSVGNQGFESTVGYIYNLTDISSFTDIYVNAGTNYTYYIVAVTENDWVHSKEVTVKATAGSGERQLTATADSNGIHFTGEKIWADSNIRIVRHVSGSNNSNYASLDNFTSSTKQISAADYWVSDGQEYIYRIEERPKENSHWEGDVWISGDDYLVYPRYKSIIIKAKGGLGSLRITNNPAATFDSQATSADDMVNFSVNPKIPIPNGSDYNFRIEFNYYRNNYNNTYIYYDSNKNDSWVYNNNQNSGKWDLNRYYIFVNLNDYWYYENNINDFSNLSGIPQSLTF